MRLVLHQIMKDLRLLRWHLAAWLLVVTAANVLVLVVASRWFPDHDTLKDIGFIVSILDVAATGVLVVVAASVVQADAPTSTTAFWPTRPAPRAVLAASKIVFGLVFLALVPVACDAITLAAFGVSPAWMPPLALAVVAAWTFVPMAAAAVTPSLPQFFLITLFQVVIYLAVVGIGDALGVRPSSAHVAFVGLFVIAAATSAFVVVVAYLSRRQRLSSALIGFSPLLVFAVVVTIWPYRMDAAWRFYERREYGTPVHVDIDTARITMTPSQGTYRLALPLRLEGVPGGTRVDILPSTNRSWIEASGKRVQLDRAPALIERLGDRPARDWDFLRPVIGERFALLNPSAATLPTDLTYVLRLLSGDYARYADQSAALHIAVVLRFSEWRAATTMKLQKGARYRVDGGALEVGDVRVEGGQVFAAMRETHSSPYAGTPALISCFLRNRATGEAIASRFNHTRNRGLAPDRVLVQRVPVFPVMHDLWVEWLDRVFDVNLSPSARATGTAAWLASSELLIVTRRDMGSKEVEFDLRNVRLGDLPPADLSPADLSPRTDVAREEASK